MKRPKDMTHDELCALPEQGYFDKEIYTVAADGTITRDGQKRTIAGLRPGDTVCIPRPVRARASFMGPDDIMAFQDREGRLWRPVEREDGSWAKQAFTL